MSDRKQAYGADLVIPAAALAFTIYFLTTTSGMEWEAKANGVFVGWMLIALVVAQVARIAIGYMRGRGDFGFGPLVQPAAAMRKRLGMMAITIAFVAAVPWLGVGLGLFLGLSAGFAVMGVRPVKRIFIVAFSMALACALLFNGVLDTGLPSGPVEKLIHHFIATVR